MTHFISSFPGREISINDENFLYFGGTSYLGLQADVDFQEIFISNVRKYGTAYGASRQANVQFSIYEEAENHLAKIIGSDSAITMSSGFLTGQLVAQYFILNGHPVFYAPHTHEALKIDNTPNYNNYNDLIQDINACFPASKTPVLFLDTLLLNGKHYPDFTWLQQLPLNDIIIVADDSHGFGITGKNGGGSYSKLKNNSPKEIIVCGSLGKGFGIQAGVIAGDSTTITQLKAFPMYGAASPASPATLATFVAAKNIYAQKQKALENNISFFVNSLKQTDAFKFLDKYPNFILNNSALASYLQANKIIITNFNYPDGDSLPLQRIVLSAQHTKADIVKLATAINTFYAKN